MKSREQLPSLPPLMTGLSSLLPSGSSKFLASKDSLGSDTLSWRQPSIWSSSVSRDFPEFHPKPRSSSPVSPSLLQYFGDRRHYPRMPHLRSGRQQGILTSTSVPRPVPQQVQT